MSTVFYPSSLLTKSGITGDDSEYHESSQVLTRATNSVRFFVYIKYESTDK